MKVEGQSAAANDTLYLMTDGHGSTRALIDLGAVVQEREDYDAFGAVLGSLTATASTTKWLFGGDGLYDPATGWRYNLERWVDGWHFSSFDPLENDPAIPHKLHKYLYANGNPVNNTDPSGNTTLAGTLVTSSIIGGLTGMIVGGIRGGVRGAIGGAISGAIFAPVVTLGAVGFGLGIAAATGISTTAGLFTSFALTTAGSLAWNTYEYVTAKNEREKLAAGVSMVFTLGFAAYGSYKFSEIPSLPNNAAAGGGLFPNSRGNWGSWLSESMAALRGERVVAREVTIEAGGVKVRVDLVVRTLSGTLKFIESKFGPGARFTDNQKVVYPEMSKTGGTIVYDNAASAGLPAGTRLPATDVQVDTWNGAHP